MARVKKLLNHHHFDLFTLCVCFVVCFFIYLGFWQLQRADEKKSILLSLSEAPKSISIKSLSQKKVSQYQKILLSDGYWLSHEYLKQNVVKDNQLGMQVYGIFCQKNDCLIVNQGWLPNDQKSKLKKNIKKNYLIGVIRPLPYILIDEKYPLNFLDNFGLIVSLDAKFFSKLTNKNVLPYEVVVDQSLTYYQILTTLPGISVARHYGYAIQFYLLALVVVIGYIYIKK